MNQNKEPADQVLPDLCDLCCLKNKASLTIFFKLCQPGAEGDHHLDRSLAAGAHQGRLRSQAGLPPKPKKVFLSVFMLHFGFS